MHHNLLFEINHVIQYISMATEILQNILHPGQQACFGVACIVKIW